MTPVAALRNPNAFLGTEFAHVEVVQADLFDEQSLIAAAEDVEAIAAHLPFVFDLGAATKLGQHIAAATVQNNVRKVVFNTSCFVAEKDNGNPPGPPK